MTIIETIKAKVERLKRQLIRGACAAQIEMETNCKEEAYDEVLAILDTLEEQPACEGLEEAARLYAGLCHDREMEYDSYWHDVDTFKAGAKWQKEQMMKED